MSLRQIKVELFLKDLPRKFMIAERRAKGQSILVPGPRAVLNKMG